MGIRRFPKTVCTLAAGVIQTVWPAQTASDTNNYARVSRYRSLSFIVVNTGGANAVTASSIQGAGSDADTFTAILTDTLLPAVTATAIDSLNMQDHGMPDHAKLRLTSTNGTTVEITVIGEEA